ncbi:hypothetical protein HUJ04_001064 [Dendroctonus ponderosae]|nr:hypothetical protein HUJ04_001064 [Dendroctonus ponderosae]
MKRTRTSVKKYVQSSDSEDDRPLKKPSPNQKTHTANGGSSSSESDIETYLHRPEKLNFDSEFFASQPTSASEFASIEKSILAGVKSLSDGESDSSNEASELQSTPHKPPQQGAAKQSFNQFEHYTKQMAEAKKQVEIYKAKKQAQEKQTNILNLLAVGEGKSPQEPHLTAGDFHDSDFESCDSEQEDWEEIKNLSQDPKAKNIVPAKGLQIVVDMPDVVKKKKGIDLVAAMKRRLNRIRKENQLLVHQVHLLCWIAHGNYVNSVLNDTQTLALALSLLPSEQSYPNGRTDLSYLEQITAWYHKTFENIEKPTPKNISLADSLQKQINTKQAYNKKMLALIFVAILRALGIQARIVMSLQVEPLRPPASDLHSLSAKTSASGENAASKGDSLAKQGTPKAKVSITLHKPTPVKRPAARKALASEASKTESQGPKAKGKRSSKLATELVQSSPRAAESQLQAGKIATKKRTKSTENEKLATQTSRTRAASAGGKVSQGAEKAKSPRSAKSAAQTSSHDATKSEENNNQNPAGGAKPRLAKLRKRKSATSPEPAVSATVEPSAKMQKSRKKSTLTENPDGLASAEPNPNTAKNLRSSRRSKVILQIDGLCDSESEAEAADQRKKPSRSKPNLKKLKALKVGRKTAASDSDSEFEPSGSFSKRLSQAAPDLAKLKTLQRPSKSKALDVKQDIVGLVKNRMAEEKQIARSRLVKQGKSAAPSDSDSDYAPEPVRKRHQDSGDDFTPKAKVKRRIPAKPEPEEKSKKQGSDVWVEVFLECEEKWITVDVMLGQVHCIKNIVQRATRPIAYVLAWDNNRNVKDVTQRYCQNFNTITRKLRINQKWWNESLKPFQAVLTARDREEDEDLARQQLDQPLPKVISEYKDHPLYALRRHLLKFEAIYPPEPATLGFVRGEAVYPRACVYTLHSRDIWLKQAKVVRMGEQPYKIVKARPKWDKARPKWDKLSNQVITDQLLEIFGSWQVQDYEPPTAENGVVPRNAFGNVDLFKPCMLPKGCVHLRLPGLNKIAKKMNIDCASAIVGFDFHGGWSHPCYDGFVVCKEYEDQLICAWDNEQEEMERKEQMQHDKRVYGNWKKLIRGLLIRERLKAKYDFGAPSTSSKQPKKKTKKVTLCTKKP